MVRAENSGQQYLLRDVEAAEAAAEMRHHLHLEKSWRFGYECTETERKGGSL